MVNDSNCTSYLPPCDLFFWTAVAGSLIGAIPALIYIVILIAAKAYKTLVHRLSLYLALAGLVFAVMWPPWKKNDIVSQTQAPFRLYSGLLFCLLTVYISGLVFTVAVCKLRLKVKHEIVGIVIVVAVPLLCSWVPFLHAWEEYSSRINAGFGGLVVLQLIVSNVAFFSVLAVLCKKASDPDDFLRNYHKRTLKAALPLFVYVVGLQLASCLFLSYQLFSVLEQNKVTRGAQVFGFFYHLLPCWCAGLPFLLIWQLPRFMLRLGRRIRTFSFRDPEEMETQFIEPEFDYVIM